MQWTFASLWLPSLFQVNLSSPLPQVSVHNGTIEGKHLDNFDQDVFLGIPYAQPPLGSLRFAPSQPINHSWTNPLRADHYGAACWANSGSDSLHLDQSEDCLSLNVIRPAGDFHDLPVAVWIHGGGFNDGSSSRPAYNLSYIVQNGVELGKPFIGVSINYRLGGYGYLSSSRLSQKGWTNVGLRDQVLALNWVKENIGAFGGDPDHIVLWGESAGSISIGQLLLSGEVPYVRGAIMESGTGILQNTKVANNVEYEADFKALLEYTDCSEADDSIGCLQRVEPEKLGIAFDPANGIMNKSKRFPYVDGGIIGKSLFETYEEGQFTKVPILIGTTSDEGAIFVPPNLVNDTESSISYLRTLLPNLSEDNARALLGLYPADDPSLQFPLQANWVTTTIPPTSNISEFHRVMGTLIGDLMFGAVSRWVSEFHALHGLDVFKYRFNIPTQEMFEHPASIGATHFSEVPYVFYNGQKDAGFRDPTDGRKWLFDDRSESISKTVSQLWISFITDLNPNTANTGVQWTNYKDQPKNLVVSINGFYEEEDDYRDEQFNFFKEKYYLLDM